MTGWLEVSPSAPGPIRASIFLAGLVRGLTGSGLAILLMPLIGQPERAVLRAVLTSPARTRKERRSGVLPP